MKRPMDLLTKIGMGIGMVIIIIDKFLFPLNDALAITGYGIALVLMTVGIVKTYRENSGKK